MTAWNWLGKPVKGGKGHSGGGGGGTVTPAPTDSIAPSITGTISVGSVLSCSTGTWNNTPTNYSYQWKRDGVTVGTNSASNTTYTITTADQGHSLQCVVTAINSGGQGTATSNTVAVPAAVTPPPPVTGTLTLGMNLQPINYWRNNIMFTDHSHGGDRPNIISMPSGAVPVNVDANYWPTGPNAGDTFLRYIFQPPEVAGPMTITVNAGAIATVTGFLATFTGFTSGAATFTGTPQVSQITNSGWAMDVTFIGGQHITSLSVKPQGVATTYSANFLAHQAALTNGGPIRPMQLINGWDNFNNQTAWLGGTQASPVRAPTAANRCTPSTPWDYVGGTRKSDGVPFETLVDMANTVSPVGGLWFNVGWNASDDYITFICDYAAAHLTGKFYLAVSNEVWNGGANPYYQARAEGIAEALPNAENNAIITNGSGERYCERFIEVMTIAKARFAAASKTSQLYRTFEWQNGAGNYWTSRLLDYVPPGKTAVKNWCDVFAVSPYFGNITLDTSPPRTSTDVQAFFDAGYREVDASLASAVDCKVACDARTNDRSNVIKLAFYEWGQSFIIDDATTNNTVQRDPRMYALYKYALGQAYSKLGNIVINIYANVDVLTTAYGSWGTLEASSYSIDQTNPPQPKARAIRDFILGV